jgi:hypothetical protein
MSELGCLAIDLMRRSAEKSGFDLTEMLKCYQHEILHSRLYVVIKNALPKGDDVIIFNVFVLGLGAIELDHFSELCRLATYCFHTLKLQQQQIY